MRIVIVSCSLSVLVACGGAKPTPAAPSTPSSSSSPPPSDSSASSSSGTAGGDPMCANHPDELGPWLLSAAQVPQRIGTGVTALASIQTSKSHTIEVCGVPAENAWLAASTCADGSHPYKSPDAVERTRNGNVGPGGRCGGIIDLYEVPCPERTYEVYIDMNLCGPGESFM